MAFYITLYNLIDALLAVYGYILIATAILSWVPDLANSQLGRILDSITDPYLRLFRRFIPPLHLGGLLLDVSFIVAVVVYFFLREGVLSVLFAVLGRLSA
ncbi:MAG: YggT family protein [Alicyclobacillus sp.]|nr:YggT family protein [Alicyclobacillus sp.]